MAKKTQTSSFGTSKREGHDSSIFYQRSLYERNGATNGVFKIQAALSDQEINQIKSSELSDWIDKIYQGTSENMQEIPDNSVGLAFTSPPYNVGKDYDDDLNLDGYLELIKNVGKEIYRVLRPGGRYVINIANLGRKPYIPLNGIFFKIHMELDFLPMGEIIWRKAKGAGNSTAWGSWISAKSPRLRDVHEYLLVFAKQSFSRPDSGIDSLVPTEFLNATISIWDIPPESATKVGHPAPFPVELAEKVINLYSYEEDVVLDPFVGSGTTCLAAKLNNRHYVGYDTSEEYCKLARTRITDSDAPNSSSAKTEATELSVAFGLLQVDDPVPYPFAQTDKSFAGSLSRRKFHTFKNELKSKKHKSLYSDLLEVGRKIRANYAPFAEITSLLWRSERKQTSSILPSPDLLVNDVAVSVKARSNLVLNTSPHNMFVQMPQGIPNGERAENWYLRMAPGEYQNLYDYVKNTQALSHLPATVDEFEKDAHAQKHELLQAINALKLSEQAEFEKLYVEMCHKVAEESAREFERHLCETKNSHYRSVVLENIARELFKLDTTEYILAGMDGNENFAVQIPALHTWRKKWEIQNIEAKPDLSKGQSVVNLVFTFQNVQSRDKFLNLHFRIEIRWSHGKFRHSPEAKVYKDFKWREVEFFTTLL